MKKYIFTLVFCIGVLSANASYLPSDLTIRMWDYSMITVVFDGASYSNASTSFTVSNVAGGNHFLKVFRYGHDRYGHPGSVPKMVFSGYIHVSAGKSITGMISNDFRFVVLSEYNLVPGNGNHYGNGNGGHHGNHNGGYYSGYEPNGGYDSDYNYTAPGMSAYDFMALKSVVANSSFDDTKLTICKQALSSSAVTSSQVCELMRMMTFESNKLELAKFAYRNVVDKSRYYLVNSAFTFSSSVDELNRYIMGY